MRGSSLPTFVWSGAARLVWAALAVLCVSLFVAALPAYWQRLRTPCEGADCIHGQLPAETLARLEALGPPPSTYAWLASGLNVAVVVVSLGVSALIVARGGSNWATLTTSTALLTLSTSAAIGVLPDAQPAWAPVVQFLGWLTACSLGLFFYTFPNGRFVPRWTLPLAVGWFGLMALDNFSMEASRAIAASPLIGPLALLFFGSFGLAQVVRYRRVSNAVERQQTKWVVFGVVLGLSVFQGHNLATNLVPGLGQPGALLPAAQTLVDAVMILALALSVGIAVLRYRLWDIDLLINRALVYGVLTVLLTALYFSVVVVLQALLRAVTGSGTPLASVTSTLLLAALFRPLRRRVQTAIDRRFYRRKYSAAQVLAAFGAVMRDEVDLDRATARLEGVVGETLQPREVWLWLRSPPERQGTGREAQGHS